jgi:hypothetical protein
VDRCGRAGWDWTAVDIHFPLAGQKTIFIASDFDTILLQTLRGAEGAGSVFILRDCRLPGATIHETTRSAAG